MFRVFGCTAYVFVQKDKRKSLQPHMEKWSTSPSPRFPIGRPMDQLDSNGHTVDSDGHSMDSDGRPVESNGIPLDAWWTALDCTGCPVPVRLLSGCCPVAINRGNWLVQSLGVQPHICHIFLGRIMGGIYL